MTKKDKRCGNCKWLNVKEKTDIGGMTIAKCIIPGGTKIGDTEIDNDYVEPRAVCGKHEGLGA